MYKILSAFLLYFSVKWAVGNLDLTINYYQELIEEETTRALAYQLPTENVEFKKAFESELPIEEFGTYDFVIVGGGTAGSVVATRLSEISDFEILLIEAGDEENDFSKIPGMCFFNQYNKFNWGYYTVSQKYSCLGMVDRKCLAVRGKAIGGSSSINAALYIRGNSNNFDNWARLGNDGWSFKDVLPYFKKSQNSQIRSVPKYQGIGGFWNIEYVEPESNLSNIFFEANREMKIPYIEDYNGPCQLGAAKLQTFIKHGQRQSTGSAFLDNARQRKNLKVITKAMATRIIMEEKVAKGIEFVTYTKKYRVYAKKEVILSAGVFNTPQLLMLSGIGPKSELKRLKIDLVKDLPVGKQLLNNPHFLGLVFNSNYIRSTKTLKQMVEEYLKGKGLLTIGDNCQATNFLRTSTKSAINSPSFQNLLLPADSLNDKLGYRIFNYNQDTDDFLKKTNSDSSFTISIIPFEVKSKGRVTLQSKSPIDFPIIDANMLSEKEDLDVIIEAIEENLRLIQTKPFKKINATLLEYNICQNFDKFSRLFWECIVRHLSAGTNHYCGTTPMGPSTSNGSVVDKNLLVHDILRLRIVDSGVFPTLVAGHTTATTVMVAEKISDEIKKQHNLT